MAIHRSSPDQPFHPKKTFAGRKDECKLFRQELHARQSNETYKVLHWYGVGGQGKSTLSRELMRIFNVVRDYQRTRKSGRLLAGARIEFETSKLRQPDQALLALRLQLGQSGKIRFPSFDLAFARYITLNNPGVRIRDLHPELFRGDSEILDDVMELLEGGLGSAAGDIAGTLLPGLNIFVKYAHRLTQRSREWFESRGRTELGGLDLLSADEILARLPIYFGYDMHHALQDRAELRAVIMLDGYEALWRDSPRASNTTSSHRTDQWVRLLVSNCPGVLFAIFGRDELAWSDLDADWDSVIDPHSLGGLSDADAESFLKKVPVEESEIRREIIEGAKGLPFYLDLQVDLYSDLKNAGRLVAADQFGGNHPDILARFLDHIGQSEELVLRILSYPSQFSEADLTSLANTFLGGAALYDWSKVVARSFISDSPDGTFTMHRLMRELLQNSEKRNRPTVFQEVHKHLFGEVSSRIPMEPGQITSLHDQLFWECEGHLRESGVDSTWIDDAISIFTSAARNRLLHEFYSREYLQSEQSLGPEHPHTLTTRHNLAQQLGELGEHRAARDEFQAIYDIQKRPDMLGPEHPSTLTTRANIALMQARLGEFAHALTELSTVQVGFSRLFDAEHRRVLLVKGYIAEAHILSGDVEKGCAMAREVCCALRGKFVETHFQIRDIDRLIAAHCCGG